MRIYIDTSAALKVLTTEEHTSACTDFFNTAWESGDTLLASTWLEAEMRSIARRYLTNITPSAIASFLSLCTRVGDTDDALATLVRANWTLRSGDGLHLALALTHNADAILTYDKELVTVAHSHGLQTISPA
ncbi:MAG: type II toxin-antitoxin system VapC family toxin [Actinomycetaceae bacterium]|nr:type II toxin-antitoxin system VapC family toxin [Actinomycetaceae bacterium]